MVWRHPRSKHWHQLDFVITREGKVERVGLAGEQTLSVAMQNCVVTVFRNMRFPQPEGGEVRVAYPLVFAPND